MKRFPALLLALILTITPLSVLTLSPAQSKTTSGPTDSYSSPYYQEILWAYDKGLEYAALFNPQTAVDRYALYRWRAVLDGVTDVDRFGYYSKTGLIQVSEEERQRQIEVNGSMDYYFYYPATTQEMCKSFPELANKITSYLEDHDKVTKEYFIHILYESQTGLSFSNNKVEAEALTPETRPVQVYTAKDFGFQKKEGESTVRAMTEKDETYYNLFDVAELLGRKMTTTEEYSTIYYTLKNGDYYTGTKVYDIPALGIQIGDRHLQICKGTVFESNAWNSNCFVLNEEPYLAAGDIMELFPYVIQKDGGLRLLEEGQGRLSLVKNSFNTPSRDAAKQEILTNALWLLYNAWEDGFNLVVNNADKVDLIDNPLLTHQGAAFDGGAGNVIYITPDYFDENDLLELACTLAHEGTHYQQFETGNYSEDVTVLNQMKAWYYVHTLLGDLDDCHRVPTYALTSDYDKGYKAGIHWLAEQGFQPAVKIAENY